MDEIKIEQVIEGDIDEILLKRIHLEDLEDDHDCRTPQGDGCAGCEEILKLREELGQLL